MPSGACESGPAGNTDIYVEAKFPGPPSGGACSPSGGEPTIAPPSFNDQAALCSTPSTSFPGCATGTCMPSPPAGYNASLCVYQTGDVLCPAPTYTVKTTVYQTFTDTRACSACACGAPAGATCTGQILFFPGPGCGGQEDVVPITGACSFAGLGNIFGESGLVYIPQGETGGTCAASGGTPTGSVAGATPITVCCTK